MNPLSTSIDPTVPRRSELIQLMVPWRPTLIDPMVPRFTSIELMVPCFWMSIDLTVQASNDNGQDASDMRIFPIIPRVMVRFFAEDSDSRMSQDSLMMGSLICGS